jgi:hypothetical protein
LTNHTVLIFLDYFFFRSGTIADSDAFRLNGRLRDSIIVMNDA